MSNVAPGARTVAVPKRSWTTTLPPRRSAARRATGSAAPSTTMSSSRGRVPSSASRTAPPTTWTRGSPRSASSSGPRIRSSSMGGSSRPCHPACVPVTVPVVLEERYWYPDDGGIVWVAGYHLVGADGAFIGRDDPRLAERGLRVTGVAGAGRHHPDALQGDVGPGRALELRREPDNPHDANAIAVHAPGGEKLGFVPREPAAELAGELDAGRPWAAVVLREQRPSPREPRTGLTMLLAAADAIELDAR